MHTDSLDPLSYVTVGGGSLEVEIRHFERSRSPHVALAHTYRGAGGAKSRDQRNKTALFALVACDSFVCFTDAIYIRV